MKTTTTYKLVIMLFLLGGVNLTAQNNIGINTETPDSSAILDIYSEEKGVLVPRLTSEQKDSIGNPANSLLIFDIDLQSYTYFDTLQSEWIVLPNKAEIFWVKNNDHIHNINPENVGIGTVNPRTDLHIKGRTGQESGLTITNEDSTYSIIIVIDINEEGIIVKGDNHIDEKLLYQILENGKFGLGTKPSSLLHLKPNEGVEPKIQISNEDSTYNIIIVIDINEEGITVKGNDTENERILYSADKIGRFGVGLNNPRNVLHLKSDTLNPNIRLTSPSYSYDYVLGFDSLTSAFIIKRMFNSGNSENVFVQVDSNGDVAFNSLTSNVNISPGVTTNEIEFNNPLGDNPIISVDENGNLDLGQTIGSKNGILSVNFLPTTLNASNQVDTLVINQNLLPNTPSAFNFNSGSSTITINETGYYEINYTISISTTLNSSQFSEITRRLITSSNTTIPNSTFVNEFKNNQFDDETTLLFSQIFYFNEGDDFKLQLTKNNNQGFHNIFGSSTLNIKKIAN